MGKRGRPRRAVRFCKYDARVVTGKGDYCSVRCRRLARGEPHDPRLDASPNEIQEAYDQMLAAGEQAAEALRAIAAEIAGDDLQRGTDLAVKAALFRAALSAVISKQSLRRSLAGANPAVRDKISSDKTSLTSYHGGMQAMASRKITRTTTDFRDLEASTGKQTWIVFYLPQLKETQALGFGPEGVAGGVFQEWVRRCVAAGNKDKALIAEMREWQKGKEKRVAKRREREKKKKV